MANTKQQLEETTKLKDHEIKLVSTAFYEVGLELQKRWKVADRVHCYEFDLSVCRVLKWAKLGSQRSVSKSAKKDELCNDKCFRVYCIFRLSWLMCRLQFERVLGNETHVVKL